MALPSSHLTFKEKAASTPLSYKHQKSPFQIAVLSTFIYYNVCSIINSAGLKTREFPKHYTYNVCVIINSAELKRPEFCMSPSMINCSRCCLRRSIMVINITLNAVGVAMIIYSLWFLKKWEQGFNDQSVLVSALPTPWFIYTCLGVGIVVCLGTLVGHMTANCASNFTLAIYFVSICCLLLIQAVIIVTVFFRIDWNLRVSRYIDEHHKDFKSFILFHAEMCCLLSITVSIAQLSVTSLVVILWAVGCEPTIHRSNPDDRSYTYSFLEGHPSSSRDSPGLAQRFFKFPVGETLRRSLHLIQDPIAESIM